jgi:hypothetical protein
MKLSAQEMGIGVGEGVSQESSFRGDGGGMTTCVVEGTRYDVGYVSMQTRSTMKSPKDRETL